MVDRVKDLKYTVEIKKPTLGLLKDIKHEYDLKSYDAVIVRLLKLSKLDILKGKIEMIDENAE